MFYLPFDVIRMAGKDSVHHRKRELELGKKKNPETVVEALASCDGLLLVISHLEGRRCRLSICNPITGSNTRLSSAPHAVSEHSGAYELTVVRDGSIGRYKVFAMQRDVWPDSRSRRRTCHVFKLDLREGGKVQSGYSRKKLKIKALTDEWWRWSICSSAVVRRKVYWLAENPWARDSRETKLIWVDMKYGEFSASDSFRGIPGRGHYFAIDKTFYHYSKSGREDRSELWTLKSVEHPTWTECAVNASSSESCWSCRLIELILRISTAGNGTSITEFRRSFDTVSMKWVNTRSDVDRLWLLSPNDYIPHVHSLVGAAAVR